MRKFLPVILILSALLFSCQSNSAGHLPPPPKGEVTQKPGPWHDELKAFRDTANYANPPAKSVLFVGSSSFRMWETAEQEFATYNVINRGFGGSRMSDVLDNYNELVLHYHPSAIFVYEGDNDIYEGKSPRTVADEYRTFLGMVRRDLGDIPVILLLPKPSGSRWHLRDQYRDLAARLTALADEDPATGVIDSWDYFLDDQGVVRDELFQDDQLHMNQSGYDIWRSLISPVLEALKL